MQRIECKKRLDLIEPTIEEMGIQQMIQSYVSREGTDIFHEVYESFFAKHGETVEKFGFEEYLTLEKWDEISFLLVKYLIFGRWKGLSRVFLEQLPNYHMAVLFEGIPKILPGFMTQILENYIAIGEIFVEDSCGDFDVIAYYIQNDFKKGEKI